MERDESRLNRGLVAWAYWMVLFLCLLSIPLCLLYGGMTLNAPSVPQWRWILPLLPAAVSWVVLDVLARARTSGKKQHGLIYLTLVCAACLLSVAGFLFVLFPARPTLLAVFCIFFSAVPTTAVCHILADEMRPCR